ncbi:MAG: hypothetical protein N3H30_00150 [Candidatus Micrarchaeota archaeon]|nr:hypothetical protein [Candidatus Micrarchaeota archaeon]
MIGISSIISIDLVVAFVLAVLIFYIAAQVMAAESHSLSTQLDSQAELAACIARSYEVVSALSEGRDNEVMFSKMLLQMPKNASLRTSSGYLYGGPREGPCIARAVYVIDLGTPAILEVC